MEGIRFQHKTAPRDPETDLANRHRRQNVKEDERTVREIFAREIPVTETLKPGNGDEGQFGNDSSVEAVKINVVMGKIFRIIICNAP